MRQIAPVELRDQLETANPKPLLLDVREPQEFAYCRITGSLNIPMNEVPARLGELDPDREIVVICHHGIRSANVAAYLLGQNFAKVSNLSGGIDAWAVQVEPGMPRY